jgi:hypothetical protein
MRRAITCIDDETVEVRLRNISSMGASVECPLPVLPGTELAIDIVGVGPIRATVQWSQSGKFGVKFGERFDLGRLAPKKERRTETTMMRPWYIDRRTG